MNKTISSLFLFSLLELFIFSSPPVVFPADYQQKSLGYVLEKTVAGELKWVIKADEVEYLPQGNVNIKNISIKLGHETLISARRGRVREEGDNSYSIHLEGEVRIVSKDLEIETSSLDWQEKEGRITSPGKVRILKGGVVFSGRKLVAEPEFKKIKLREVECQIK